MPRKSAAVIALELYHEPRLANRLASMPLHDGVLSLIKIAAGDESEAMVFPSHISENFEKAHAISVFYLQQVIFHPHSSGHRILGLSSDAGQKEIRDHKRWLLKWLHPDRNQNKWEQHYFKRVLEAAQSLQSADTQPVVHQPSPKLRESRSAISQLKHHRVSVAKLQPVKLNVWPRLKTKLKQISALGVLALIVYFSSTQSEVTSAITRSIPDLTSLFYR